MEKSTSLPLTEIVQYIDPHIAIRLVDQYDSIEIFNKDWLLKEKLALYLKTRLFEPLEEKAKTIVDYAQMKKSIYILFHLFLLIK